MGKLPSAEELACKAQGISYKTHRMLSSCRAGTTGADHYAATMMLAHMICEDRNAVLEAAAEVAESNGSSDGRLIAHSIRKLKEDL